MGRGRAEGSKEPELLGDQLLMSINHQSPPAWGRASPWRTWACRSRWCCCTCQTRPPSPSLLSPARNQYLCQNSIYIIGHTLHVCFEQNANVLFWDLNSTMWEPRTWGRFNCLKVSSSQAGDALSKVSIIVISCNPFSSLPDITFLFVTVTEQ